MFKRNKTCGSELAREEAGKSTALSSSEMPLARMNLVPQAGGTGHSHHHRGTGFIREDVGTATAIFEAEIMHSRASLAPTGGSTHA
jgi:hypothetical protein